MEHELTHSIPVMAYSTNPVEFIRARTKATEGKQMINEVSSIQPQYIIEHSVSMKKNTVVKSAQELQQQFYLQPATLMYYYTYYGEYRCTQQDFEKWAKENEPKKV